MQSVPKDIQALADFLDNRFRGPFGFRFGWDGLIGLVPGVGDLLTTIASFYIIVRAATLGVSVGTLLRMGLNVVLDSLFDAVPIFGMFFDFAFKANVRNVALLQKDLGVAPAVAKTSRWLVFAVLAVIFLVLALACALVFAMAAFVYQQFFV